jgi:hypothetical protein
VVVSVQGSARRYLLIAGGLLLRAVVAISGVLSRKVSVLASARPFLD